MSRSDWTRSRTICGAVGCLFVVKATLYQYILKKYGAVEAPKDIKLPGTPVTEGELFFPDADTLPDGDLMLELNALKDKFCITFQLIDKDRKPLDLFLELLKQEGVPYSVSERYTRYMPKIALP